MTDETEIVLALDQVSRLYPRDISDTPSAILREMLLPRRLLNTPGPDSFFALRDVSLRLRKGQKLGVIGAHRSGKTSLAGIASGVLQPTSGNVSAHGSRLLISRPTAGFKPTLTSIENLRLRASLAGLHGKRLDAVLDRTLSRCGVDGADARIPMGNLSPYVVKQLGLTLLLELPADILVVDEISSAGIGDARWLTRGLLHEKIDASTALVISSDFSFIQEVVEEAVLLHQGKLYGPFSVENALDYYSRLPDESVPFGDIANDPSIEEDHDSYGEVDDDGIKLQQRKSKFFHPPTWKVLRIDIDGSEFKHTHYSLIRHPGESVNVEVEMISSCKQIYSGGVFVLHGGSSGLEVGHYFIKAADMWIEAQQKYLLRFTLRIPDWQEDFYGLTFCPQDQERNFPLDYRMKILILGVAQKHSRVTSRELEIHNYSLEMEDQ